MNLISIMSVVILFITIVTLALGVVAYFMYKMRESRRRGKGGVSYGDGCTELEADYIFFDKN